MKNIIVTGASKGLGLEITQKIIKNGDVVYALNRSTSYELKELQEQNPQQLHILNFDLEQTDKIKSVVFKHFIDFKTPIHGFVNNAALAYDDIVTNANLEKLSSMFAVNVFSPIILAKYVIRHMLLHKIEGSIVHISSISVHTGYKGLSMYAASKGAIEAFSKNTAREWGERKVRSNCIVAGFMETSMSAILTSDQKNRIYNRTSLKIPTSLESVADTALFLLSAKAASITGQNIFVDSGTI